MITRELLRGILTDAPLPHTAGEDVMGRAPVVASNGRLLGWVASRSTNWRAVAEFWGTAAETIQALYKTIDSLYERIGKTDDERDQLAIALRYAVDDEARLRAALESIAATRIPYAGRTSREAIELVEIAESALEERQ